MHIHLLQPPLPVLLVGLESWAPVCVGTSSAWLSGIQLELPGFGRIDQSHSCPLHLPLALPKAWLRWELMESSQEGGS